MVGTLINTVAILVGTALGLLLRKGIPERLRETVVQGQGLCVILIGLSGALKTGDTLFALVDGVVRFERLGRDKKQVSVYPVETNAAAQ